MRRRHFIDRKGDLRVIGSAEGVSARRRGKGLEMKKTETWIAVIVAGIGLVVTVVLGVFAYITLTATPIHPSAQEISSVSLSAPPPKWAEAVEQGRQIDRASVIEQNLPG